MNRIPLLPFSNIKLLAFRDTEQNSYLKKYWIELSFSEGMLNRTQPLKRTCQLFFNFCKYRKMELASSIAALNQLMHSYGTPPVKLAHISFCECLNWWAVYARAHTVSSIGYMEFSPQMLVYPIQQPNSYLNSQIHKLQHFHQTVANRFEKSSAIRI